MNVNMKFSTNTLAIAIALAHVLVTFSNAQPRPFISQHNLSDVVEYQIYHPSHTRRLGHAFQQSAADDSTSAMLNFLDGFETKTPTKQHSEKHSKRSVLFELQEHVAAPSYQQSMTHDLKEKRKQVVRNKKNFQKSHFPFSILF